MKIVKKDKYLYDCDTELKGIVVNLLYKRFNKESLSALKFL